MEAKIPYHRNSMDTGHPAEQLNKIQAIGIFGNINQTERKLLDITIEPNNSFLTKHIRIEL
jgi:hypothetical protein